jgi:hypothetical protein
MPKRLPKVVLSSVQPTDEELTAARNTIANMSTKEQASKKASMMAFLKQHPDIKAINAKGAAKDPFVEKFHVYTMRCKQSEKKWTSDRGMVLSRKMIEQLHWWSAEKMDKELGDQKAAHWRNSGLLPTRPDKVTQSMDPMFIEYGCPQDFESYTEEDLKALKQKVEAEMDAEDVAAWDEIAKMKGFENFATKAAKSMLAPSSGSAASTAVAEEITKSDGEKMAERMESLKANVQTELSRYQLMNTNTKVTKTRAESLDDPELVAPFIKALTLSSAKIAKLCHMLERMITEPVNDTALPKVLQLMDEVDAKNAVNMDYAEKFNVGESKPAKK